MIGDFTSGNLRNYNGGGKWSPEAVRERYRDYCAVFHIEHPRSLFPREHVQGDERWIYPIMEPVITGIVEGDTACTALGVDFVEEDALFPFGARLKANTARALRRARLTDPQKVRLRQRITTMLVFGIVPHEMREYAKLLRKVGVGEQWTRLERGIPRNNRYAMRFYKVLREAEGLPPESGQPATAPGNVS